MKFGVREICDVVFKAKFPHKIGNKVFYRDEPVLYFDSLKTSTFEGASTTVYAQGGRGNARLVAWDGDRTVTFTMEDALISPETLAVLAGANVIEATNSEPIVQHIIETVPVTFSTSSTTLSATAELSYTPVETKHGDTTKIYKICAMGLDDYENIITEPFYCSVASGKTINIGANGAHDSTYNGGAVGLTKWRDYANEYNDENAFDLEADKQYYALVDYYTERQKGKMMTISADQFGGNYYVEASTLFRDSSNGKDYPAEFIIPNCKIQSNFTFNMASSGDPSTFTFTLDASPDYLKFDRSKKVFAAIQIIDDIGLVDDSGQYNYRQYTGHNDAPSGS